MYKFLNLFNNTNGDFMNIKDIMTKCIITKDVNSSLEEIASTFKNFDIGFLPITENDKVIGVLTDRDIVVKMLPNNDTNIKSYINSNIIKVNVNSSIQDVLDLMKEHKVKRVIVEENNLMVGIVSLSDLLEYDDENIMNIIKTIFYPEKNYISDNVNIKEFYL